jgi:hypothetical protein
VRQYRSRTVHLGKIPLRPRNLFCREFVLSFFLHFCTSVATCRSRPVERPCSGIQPWNFECQRDTHRCAVVYFVRRDSLPLIVMWLQQQHDGLPTTDIFSRSSAAWLRSRRHRHYRDGQLGLTPRQAAIRRLEFTYATPLSFSLGSLPPGGSRPTTTTD